MHVRQCMHIHLHMHHLPVTDIKHCGPQRDMKTWVCNAAQVGTTANAHQLGRTATWCIFISMQFCLFERNNIGRLP